MSQKAVHKAPRLKQISTNQKIQMICGTPFFGSIRKSQTNRISIL